MASTAQATFMGALIHAHDLDFDLVPIDLASLPPEEETGFRVEATEGTPELSARVLWVSDDRRTAVGVERLTPCKVIGVHVNEAYYIVEGRITALRSDGSEYEIKAGDFVTYAEGQQDTWTVHETFLKCFFYSSSRPLPYEVTP
jgi:uncharacterized cupin superfamily protein